MLIEEKRLNLGKNSEVFGIITCFIPTHAPQFYSSLEDEQPEITVKTSNLATTGEGRIGSEPHSPRTVIV